MGERESQGEPGSIAQSTQEAERPQARYRPRPRGQARAGDLRVVVAHVLPSLPQRDSHVRGGRAATSRARLLVRAELAHHLQPGRPHLGTLRDPRRPEGRRIVPSSMMKSISALQHAQSLGLRLSARFGLRPSLSASKPGLANPKADMLTSCVAKPGNVLTS